MAWGKPYVWTTKQLRGICWKKIDWQPLFLHRKPKSLCVCLNTFFRIKTFLSTLAKYVNKVNLQEEEKRGIEHMENCNSLIKKALGLNGFSTVPLTFMLLGFLIWWYIYLLFNWNGKSSAFLLSFILRRKLLLFYSFFFMRSR